MKHILHLQFASPNSTRYRHALTMMAAEDALVLAGDAVTAVTLPEFADALTELRGTEIGVLQRDLDDRGLRRRLLVDEATLLDDAALVEWIARYPRLRSWL